MIICDDVIAWAETYDGPPFHALLTDQPYHLTEVKTGQQSFGSQLSHGRHAAQRAARTGFMQSTWDGGDIAFRPDTWKALAQHLLPGAWGMAFASSRGWHRLACAIEDAGLRIQPSIFMLGWLNGQSFPKATRIDDERFVGHRYGGQVLKNSLEPIICFQKPYVGKPVDCITRTGAGSLWVDGARIGAETDTRRSKGHNPHSPSAFPHSDDNWIPHVTEAGHVGKRWPASTVLLHTPHCRPLGPTCVRGSHLDHDCTDGQIYGDYAMQYKQGYAAPDGTEVVTAYECVLECPVYQLNCQAGERKTGITHGSKHKFNGTTYAKDAYSVQMPGHGGGYGDTGAASRFFHVSDYALDQQDAAAWPQAVAAQLAASNPVMYCAKAARAERDKGLEGMPLLRSGAYGEFAGDGRGRQTEHSPARNIHPCCKPLSLCVWLAKLLAPPAAYAPRRLLVPFAGSGSECISAVLSGQWEEIVAIEKDEAYCRIAEARLRYWSAQHAATQPSLFPQEP